MFGYISGSLLHQEENTAIIQARGTGFGLELLISPGVIANIRDNADISVWIHHHITDVGQTLFGFTSLSERRLFRMLLKVNGVGGRTALALLGLGETALLQAIQLEDDSILSSVPGIGKKTAQKIIVDLKGSIDLTRKTDTKVKMPPTDTLLISSLVSMGYDKHRVEQIVKDTDASLSVEERTVLAIRELAQ